MEGSGVTLASIDGKKCECREGLKGNGSIKSMKFDSLLLSQRFTNDRIMNWSSGWTEFLVGVTDIQNENWGI